MSSLDSFQYSTAEVSANRRFEYWNDVVLRHCIPAASKPLTDFGFDGELTVRGVGVVDICSLSSSQHYWERTAKHLRCGPDDDLWLGFVQNGQGQMEQGGRKTQLEMDNLVLYDAAQAFRFSLGGDNIQLVRIPRHLLSSRLKGLENLTATVLDDSRPGVIPLREMLRQAASNPSELQSAELAGRFSQTFIDLLALSLELQDLKTAHAEQDLYARIMNYIHRNLTDRELCIKTIAEAHHVSTRTVTRAFARHQVTPMSVIWQQRLLASREAIESGRVRNVSQAALDFGFSDFSHFSHAFRRAFGVCPQSLLRRR
ncbi:hypothetical protein ADIMK_2566 [Marinobacterium lacunae]|uniref:HTH araC/xylS-type domain-containing protein n=1 Tax=Marinobacterium lacunae TaxID=1232683 RepID=A0A081FWY7_9GAMM|nr:helix-turn-helix domain-containing protein [Marinobacterium lacunae]KEA63042.1 hypothetical protein ADIMK_2566 [Marinobacterium lacunae]